LGTYRAYLLLSCHFQLFRTQIDIDNNPGWLCDYAAEFCRSAEPEQQQKVKFPNLCTK